MRSNAPCLISSVLTAAMVCRPAWAGNPHGPCYTLVLVPPSSDFSPCPPCAYMPPYSFYCPAGVSQLITESYWQCAPAPPGLSGRVRCPKTRKPVGVVRNCAMFGNAKAITDCMLMTDGCLGICAQCVAPGAGWLACLPCIACIAYLGENCTGCSVRLCTGDPNTTRPLYRWAGTLEGDPCVGR